jgi:hypothetical protein
MKREIQEDSSNMVVRAQRDTVFAAICQYGVERSCQMAKFLCRKRITIS